MKVIYDRERDDAYLELLPDWMGTEGWSNMALIRANGETIELHVFFNESDNLQVLEIKEASRWLDPETLENAEPFVPFDPREN
jgi:hypothetical protein